MKTFNASRLSAGNNVFPAKIDIDNFGVTLKIPGLLGGKEKTLSYQQISSVSIDTPMIGYSKITFDTLGFDRIVAFGFSKADAQEIKQMVQQGISGARSGNAFNQGGGYSGSPQVIVLETKSAEQVNANQQGISGARSGNASNQGDDFSGSPQVIVQETKSAEQIKAEAEAAAQRRKEVEESNAKFFDSIKKLFLGKKNKEAQELHSKLEEIEADIKIALTKGDKDEAGNLIRQLKHDSNLFVPKTSISYSKYWADKRNECLNKL